MGLDMCAFTVPAAVAGDTQVNVNTDDCECNRIAYWRKFNALHGWMERLYRAKGGTGDFNCDTVRLDIEDLDNLSKLLTEHEVTQEALQPVAGYFFGSPTIYPEDLEDTAIFITRAKQAIADGQAVFYDSWW